MTTLRYRYIDLVTEEGVELFLEEYAEVKKTPCGAWVNRFYEGKIIPCEKPRFVLDGSGRRKCHQTKEMAWSAFKMRKRNQKSLAASSLARAEYAIEQIEKLGSAPDSSLVLGKPEFWHYYVFD
jgi:hypothetical protein